MKLNELQQNPNNPRTLDEGSAQDLLVKILRYPNILTVNPIVYDSLTDNIILAGNQRQKTLTFITEFQGDLKDLYIQNGVTEYYADNHKHFKSLLKDGTIPKAWIKDGSKLTAEEKRQFIVIDNWSDGKWDFEMLGTEYEREDLEAMGFEWEMDFGGGVDNDEDYDLPDYSEKNKEIDVDDFEDKSTLKLDYTLEEYHAVKTGLNSIAQTPEQAVWKLLEEKGLVNE